MKWLPRARTLLVSVLLFGISTMVVAQEASSPAQSKGVDFGKAEYEGRCATCHGITGKGDGPTAVYLTRKTSDLTTLAKNNNGILASDNQGENGAGVARP